MMKRWVMAQEEIMAREFDQHKFAGHQQRPTKKEEWQRLAEISDQHLANADRFFAVPDLPVDYSNGVIRFAAPYEVGHSENAEAYGEYFPAKNKRRAVIVLGHWNSTRDSYNELSRYYQRFGISALRLTLPYHDHRRPADMPIAHGLLSADLALTTQSIRQAVVEVRRATHWLFEQGHQQVGIVGSSMGSMIGLMALCHERKLSSFVGYLSGADFPAVVWGGTATQHIVEALGDGMSSDLLARVWGCINPQNYLERLQHHRPRIHIGAARFDTICAADITHKMVAQLRSQSIPHRLHWYSCGHNTLALFPFRHIAGLRGIMFMRDPLHFLTKT